MEEDPWNLREYLEGLRRWWWVLLVVPLAPAGITAGVSASEPVQPLTYKATATFLLEGSAGVNNFPPLVTTRPALDAAAKQAGLSSTVEELQASVSARLVPGTDFLEINATHTQPTMAADNANAVAAEFARQVAKIRESQLSAARDELAKQLEVLGEFASVRRVADTVASTLETGLSSLNGVTLVVPAEAPVNSVSVTANHMVRDTIIALVVGVLLSVGLVMLLDYLRNPVGSAAMFQRRFNIPHLGTVPRWSKGVGGGGDLAVESDAASGFVEAIRQAAANIEFGARAWGINSIVVASPDIREGRTSLMANLAVAVSPIGKRW
ncbi:MAG: hypothetical protein BZY88_15955 [SAR202 cluster bacterium Io17-Chloro-G9]|nr:MAG: hypothetical protein BZY88_15955 [SAR202 cluster bacterium Io17-Chloro-G9]